MLPAEADRTVTKTSSLAQLLSDAFIAERHIDAYTTYLNVHARWVQQSAPKVFVADLSLAHILSTHHKASRGKIKGCKILLQVLLCLEVVGLTRFSFTLLTLVWCVMAIGSRPQ